MEFCLGRDFVGFNSCDPFICLGVFSYWLLEVVNMLAVVNMDELLLVLLIMLAVSFVLAYLIIFWLAPYIFSKSEYKDKKGKEKTER